MADINQIISLGIGTPADIPHFLLVGLSPIAAAVITISKVTAETFVAAQYTGEALTEADGASEAFTPAQADDEDIWG